MSSRRAGPPDAVPVRDGGAPAGGAVNGAASTVAHRLRRPPLHHDPPLTMRRVESRARWLLPVLAAAFIVLAVLARIDALPWDRPITNWVVDHRTDTLNSLAEKVTWVGSNV